MRIQIGSVSYDGSTDLCNMFLSKAEPRHDNYRIHRHAVIEISLILEGEGVYRTKNHVYDIHPGAVFFFRANEQHCITDVAPGGLTLLNLHFSPRFLWNIDGEYLSLFSERIQDFPNLIPHDEYFKSALLQIRAEFEGKHTDYTLLVRTYLLAALIHLARHKEMPSVPSLGNTSYGRPIVERAMDYIDANLTQPMTLEEIAKQAGVSRVYFSSLFREVYGIPLWNYIEIRRIDRAKELLRTTDDTVLTVAVNSGFNNTANFNRIFRKMTGVTPKEYRLQQDRQIAGIR